jgi:DNA polymerase/3'-5' exonuclease PolX
MDAVRAPESIATPARYPPESHSDRSEHEKMSVAGYPRRSEDAVQDIFHKVANSKKKAGGILKD